MECSLRPSLNHLFSAYCAHSSAFLVPQCSWVTLILDCVDSNSFYNDCSPMPFLSSWSFADCASSSIFPELQCSSKTIPIYSVSSFWARIHKRGASFSRLIFWASNYLLLVFLPYHLRILLSFIIKVFYFESKVWRCMPWGPLFLSLSY